MYLSFVTLPHSIRSLNSMYWFSGSKPRMKSTVDGQTTTLVARRIHSVARISGFGKRRTANGDPQVVFVDDPPLEEARVVGVHVLAEPVASDDDLPEEVDYAGDSLSVEEVGPIEGADNDLPAVEAILANSDNARDNVGAESGLTTASYVIGAESYALPMESVPAALSSSDWEIFKVTSADDIKGVGFEGCSEDLLCKVSSCGRKRFYCFVLPICKSAV
jgi:hypothetical protein